MKKLLVLTLALVLALSLSACKVNTGNNNSSGGDNMNTPTVSQNSGNANSSNTNAPVGASVPWPANDVPELPEYTYGSITGATKPSESGSMTIKAGNTSQADLDKYLQALESDGWTVSKNSSASHIDYATASKGSYSVTFQIQSDTYVQFDIEIAQAGAWPTFDQFPSKLKAPEGYALSDVSYWFDPESTDDGAVGILEFLCLNMTSDEAISYFNDLQNSGCFDTFEYNGKKYICGTSEDQIQPDGDNVHFYFETWRYE
jgi:hypothetical protein